MHGFLIYMIPLLCSLHLSVGKVWRSYDQPPLTSLAEDAPGGEQVYGRFSIPEEDTTNEELENSVVFDKRASDNSCVKRTVVQMCGGSKHYTVECRSSSLTSCHNAIFVHGTRKCKVTQRSFFPGCGDTLFDTKCGCDS